DFTAQCNDELKSVSPTQAYLENDSIFLKTTIYHQCCPAFELKISDNVNDLIMVQFTDTTSLQCDCMCHMDIIINVGKATSKHTKINYLGTWYELLPKDYSPLIEVGKTWNSLSLIPGLEYSKPSRSKYSINSDATQAFCWNGKFYHHVMEYNYGEDGEIEDTISHYIREESGKVYQVDPSGVSFDGCEEALIYDFTLDIGDTVTLGFDSIQFVVVPTATPLIYEPRQWALAEASAPEMSSYTTWIEGVGDTRGLFESSKSLQLVGVNNVLACCSLKDSLLYQDTRFPECGQRPAYQFFIEEDKTWTSITHNIWDDSYSRNDISITADKMVDNPYAMVFYSKLDDKSYYIKEANGTVYQHEGDHNYLIYDFTLNVGDTVTVGNPQEMPLHLTVDSVLYRTYEDSILRKTLYLSGAGLMTWIEGIGEINSPLGYWQPSPTNGCITSLACCAIDGKTAYINPAYPNCGIHLGFASTLSQQFSIYPNPASRGLSIIGDISADRRYQIITSIGQTVQSGILTQDIDFNLPNGIYLFVVKEDNTVLGLEKLIVE
nr:T9SS type A sorting domain-containing protein [Bacteroidales bacterium]